MTTKRVDICALYILYDTAGQDCSDLDLLDTRQKYFIILLALLNFAKLLASLYRVPVRAN